MKKTNAWFAASLALLFTGCASMGGQSAPVPRASNIDAAHYMGPWFIIAAIPLSLEIGAHDPVETYSGNPDGSIATVFQFRKGSFTGELETKPIVSFIKPGTGNAEWRVQTIWPLKEQYVISYIEPDYSSAIVARDARDHVWILSRTPKLPAGRLEEYRRRIAADGYDLSKLMVFAQNGEPPWR